MNRVDDTSVYSVSNRFDIRIMISYKQMMANSVTALYKLWVTAVMKESSSDFEAAPFWQVATCMYTCHELLWRCQTKTASDCPQAITRTCTVRTTSSSYTASENSALDAKSRTTIRHGITQFRNNSAAVCVSADIRQAAATVTDNSSSSYVSYIIRRHFSLQPSVGWHNK